MIISCTNHTLIAVLVCPIARVRIYAQWSIYGLWATTRRSFQPNIGKPSLISSFPLSCTAMPTRDGARQIPHDPYAKPCRCLACRRLWWTFSKAGYRCIAYYQSQPSACIACISTSSHSTSPIVHTFHHRKPKPPHRHINSSKTSSGIFRTGRTGKMN